MEKEKEKNKEKVEGKSPSTVEINGWKYRSIPLIAGTTLGLLAGGNDAVDPDSIVLYNPQIRFHNEPVFFKAGSLRAIHVTSERYFQYLNKEYEDKALKMLTGKIPAGEIEPGWENKERKSSGKKKQRRKIVLDFLS